MVGLGVICLDACVITVEVCFLMIGSSASQCARLIIVSRIRLRCREGLGIIAVRRTRGGPFWSGSGEFRRTSSSRARPWS